MDDRLQEILDKNSIRGKAMLPLKSLVRALELESRSRKDASNPAAREYVTDFDGDGSAYDNDLLHAEILQRRAKEDFVACHSFKGLAEQKFVSVERELRRQFELPEKESKTINHIVG